MQLTNMQFHSEPSSPKQCISPFGRSRANYTIDEFEFETSSRFYFKDIEYNLVNRKEQYDKQQAQSEDSLPEMAFADELFSEGKVLPLLPPLKLPPGLERGNDNHCGRSSSTSSPRSPGSALKFKFVHRNLWNDDFDPFLVALQSVKEDGVVRRTQANNRRPIGPHSPFPRRPNNASDQDMGPQLPSQQSKEHVTSSQPNSEKGPIEGPKKLSEPKGLAFARAVAIMDQKTRIGSNMTTMSGPILKPNENRRGGKGWKRNKLKKLLSLLEKIGLKSMRSAR